MQNDKRSATANTDRASAFVVDPVKIFLTSTSITMQNLVVVSHAVFAHLSVPKL